MVCGVLVNAGRWNGFGFWRRLLACGGFGSGYGESLDWTPMPPIRLVSYRIVSHSIPFILLYPSESPSLTRFLSIYLAIYASMHNQ